MAVDHLKIAFSILKELSQENVPEAENYGISEKQFAHIVNDLLNRGLIRDARTKEFLGHEWSTDLTEAYVTLDGEQFLKDNSGFAKTYRGLSEIRNWLDLLKP
jgi:hypothetical protein